MPESVTFCDSPPLVFLYAMDLLWILERLYKKIVVSSEVVSELDGAQLKEKDVPSVYEHKWIEMRSTQFDLYTRFKDIVGPGEASILALGCHEDHAGCLLIIDDPRCRRIAVENKLRVTGTIGVLMKAKLSGAIDTVKDKLDTFIDAGYYIDPYFYADILSLAGETEV